jgi:hypothetical protein
MFKIKYLITQWFSKTKKKHIKKFKLRGNIRKFYLINYNKKIKADKWNFLLKLVGFYIRCIRWIKFKHFN